MSVESFLVDFWLAGALVWSGCAMWRIEQRDRVERREARRCGMVDVDPATPIHWTRDPSPRRRAS